MGDYTYEYELSTEEVIAELVANRSGRFVLIGRSDCGSTGDAIFFDTVTGEVSWIDENDALHRDVVIRMFQAGASVVPKAPRPRL